MRTRGKSSTNADKEKEVKETKLDSKAKDQLAAEVVDPPQLFILPENLHKDARIVPLENPRLLTESPYIVCPEKGFYELTKVGAPKTTPRSWLLSSDLTIQDEKDADSPEEKGDAEDKFSMKGYMLRDANMLMATPFDPLFFLLPILLPIPASKTSEPPKKLFQSSEDHFEKLVSSSPQMSQLLQIDSIQQLLEKRMESVCDTAEAGDETMYRINEEKMLGELLKKVKKMTEKGLTATMEEKFVKKALEIPTLCVAREDPEDVPTLTTSTPDMQMTESVTESSGSSFSGASTAATSISEEPEAIAKAQISPPMIDAPEGVADLLRLRTALFFICSKYLSPRISDSIKKMLSSPACTIDFSPLDSHLTQLAKLRHEALASRSLGDMSRKRVFEEDEDGEVRADRKRKKDEEEKKKKAGESLAIKRLKKVNTAGMKKMSDFFKKK
ncbi:ribonuclease H2, subunit B [Tricladium varicosporioides]|nr:ribonuclease H2, subunit B [Hymenoscyphus varicosporioides]